MDKLFIVVTSKTVQMDKGIDASETNMLRGRDKAAAIRRVVEIAANPDDPREIERVFSVDEYGEVTYYEVVYEKGKLKLQKRAKNGNDVNPDPEGEWTF